MRAWAFVAACGAASEALARALDYATSAEIVPGFAAAFAVAAATWHVTDVARSSLRAA